MILLFTDFGVGGPYIGQMKAVLHRATPDLPVVDLLADAPAHDPRLASYLLAAYAAEFQAGDVFLCVVDPGVGGPRRALALEADGRWFVGPDNGLLDIVARRASETRWWEITWQPPRLSASFHGRDLFAPVAARIASGDRHFGRRLDEDPSAARGWPDDLAEIVYVDAFGNCLTGLRASTLSAGAALRINDKVVQRARTFSDVPTGTGFWYENANGLAEIAVNRGRADQYLGITVGAPIAVTAKN